MKRTHFCFQKKYLWMGVCMYLATGRLFVATRTSCICKYSQRLPSRINFCLEGLAKQFYDSLRFFPRTQRNRCASPSSV